MNIKKSDLDCMLYVLRSEIENETSKDRKELLQDVYDRNITKLGPVEKIITSTLNLTKLETSLLNAMRENEYNDALESGGCGTWTFTAIDNSGMTGKTASGVISSLVKKGLVIADVVTAKERRNGDEDSICFTELGCKLFDNADGEECQWGGLKLLKELE